MKLPKLPFRLKEWAPKDFSAISATSKARKKLTAIISHGHGLASGHGQQRDDADKKAITAAYEAKDADALIAAIQTTRHIRHFLFLVGGKNPLAEPWPLPVLRHAQRLHPEGGNQIFLLLVRIWFSCLPATNPAQEKVYKWLKLIIAAWQHRQQQSGVMPRNPAIQHLLRYSHLFFSKEPSEAIQLHCLSQSLDIVDFYGQLSLKLYDYPEFYSQSLKVYYLKMIDGLAELPGEFRDQVSENLLSRKLYMISCGDRKLGHHLLEHIIDRHDHSCPTIERELVLAIAGDPRLPPSHRQFQLWWRRLGKRRTAKVTKWLSQLDLQAFLSILEEYGRSHGKDDMVRMLSERRDFLLRLGEQNLITYSRLFLNQGAQNYLASRMSAEQLPPFARLKGAKKCLIHLGLKSGTAKVHLIEGSHNAKLWVCAPMAADHPLLQLSKTEYTPKDFVEDALTRLDPRVAIKSFSHVGKAGTWAGKVGSYLLKLGVKITLATPATPKAEDAHGDH